MTRKKMRRFAGGGQSGSADEIVVKGNRGNVDATTAFDLSRLRGTRDALSGPSVTMGGGGGGGGRGQRLTPLGNAPMPARDRMPVTPAVVRQPPSSLGRLMGNRGASGFGGTLRVPYKEGGEVKKKPKKMAKGGSTASKRADGCAQKGKTKGRFV